MTSTIQFPTYVIGLMSGTSADGVDAALLFTDGIDVVQPHEGVFVPYDEALCTKILTLMQGMGDEAAVAQALTEIHIAAVELLLGKTKTPVDAVRLIGFHGQTIRHDPAQGVTRQIGDAARLAARTGIAVVADFRSNDVAHGGQGAPLVPLYHAALARNLPKPLMVVNIGGVANVTWMGEESRVESRESSEEKKRVEIDYKELTEVSHNISTRLSTLDSDHCLLAFDCGPGNALVDDWVHRHTGKRYDKNGALAAMGTADSKALHQFMQDPFFALPPPKSLDRNHFNAVIPGLSRDLPPHAETSTAAELGASMRKEIPGQARDDSLIINGAATLTMMTARAIAAALDVVPERPCQILVTGGGRHNATLMEFLRIESGLPVLAVEEVGWNGDMLEAEAFAYLAARSVQGLPLSLPTTTGVRAPTTGGKFFDVHEPHHHDDDDDDHTAPPSCCR